MLGVELHKRPMNQAYREQKVHVDEREGMMDVLLRSIQALVD